MTEAPPRTPLPLLLTQHSGRSAMTCRFRCGNACDQEICNPTDNSYIGDLIAASVSRRGLLRAGAVLSAVGVGASLLGPQLAAAAPVDTDAYRAGEKGPRNPRNGWHARGLGFRAVPPNNVDTVTVPDGYAQQVVMAWGDPLFSKKDAFDPDRQSGRSQQRQFGYNNDYLGFLPLRGDTQLMVVNHEYTDEVLMFAGYDEENPTREQVEIAWAAHGLSVVAVKSTRNSGALKPQVGHRLNRRLHTQSEFELTGPVAGHELVRTSADPQGRTVLGTLNNCSGGLTPWGTWLTAEENFNQYFANAESVTDPVQAERLQRYGVVGADSERKWERFDDRFDLIKEPNEINRFGWIVEVDPYDPDSTPKKRTALGRFKHEAACPRITRDGRVAVYLGDDERFDYFYKFVSDGRYRKGNSEKARRANAKLLDSGTLYVAKFTGNSPAEEIDGSGDLPSDGEFDGTGTWIPLVSGNRSHVSGMSAEEVLLFTRLAADQVGATKMDRPEDVEPNPRTGTVYVALTNNTDRGVDSNPAADEANPRNGNKSGHVIEVVERGNDAGATRFGWGVFLVCGDPEDPSTYFGGFDKSQVSPISCPDNVAFDPHGNLWISTDGNALGTHDGLFGVAVEGRYRGQVKQFLTVPVGAETCGPWVDRDRVLVCVQHPGETDGSTAEEPSSQWPDGAGQLPRPGVVAVWTNQFGRKGIGEQ